MSWITLQIYSIAIQIQRNFSSIVDSINYNAKTF